MPDFPLNNPNYTKQPDMTSFPNVTVDAKANVYFDGKVVSHTVHFPDATKKTIGLIYPGKFHFGTAAPELMEIISGGCEVVLDGTSEVITVEAGSSFSVPGNSGFTITVDHCICEYICSFLPA
jgi:purine/pyrimidine-nucleoside phosphorylase